MTALATKSLICVPEEDDAVFEEPAVDVPGSLASVGLFDDGDCARRKIVAHAFNLVPPGRPAIRILTEPGSALC